VSVIDWSGATRGVPAADYARTMLLLERADPCLIHRCSFAYCCLSGVRWLPGPIRGPTVSVHESHSGRLVRGAIAHAAARLTEGITVEERRLIAFLNAARRQAAR
jgi:hypothetical protein